MAIRPNILLLLADQLRADWLGSRPDTAETPHLDRLLDRSTVFPRAICNGPVCAPSRASLSAGVYGFRFGSTSNRNAYPLRQPTFYQALRRAGYRVGLAGKMDLHKPDHYYGRFGDRPEMLHLGFTDICETEGKMNAARARSEPSAGRGRPAAARYTFHRPDDLAGPYQHYLWERGLLAGFAQDAQPRKESLPVWASAPAVLPDEAHLDRFIGRAALGLLERWTGEEPWFLCVSFSGPHDPWDAPASSLERYAQWVYPQPPPDPMTGKPDWVRRRQARQSAGLTAEALQCVKRHYAANLSVIDEQVGTILEEVERRGQDGRTVVIFASDHGEMLGDHGLFQKAIMYEAALRVPLSVSLPGQVRPRSNPALVELVDLHPTILECAGLPYLRGELDGRSMLPLLAGGDPAAHKTFQFSHLERCRAVCDGRYKLIDHVNGPRELYDLDADPGELENRAEAEPEQVRRLGAALLRCYRQLRPCDANDWPEADGEGGDD